MLIIRLQRVGKTKKPSYRLIISEKTKSTHSAYLENLGTFNPHDKAAGFKPDVERVKYWMSKGAQISGTLNNLLIKAGIIAGKKTRAVFLSKTRAAKLEEKKKATAPKTETPVA